jgi:hypothetical protein
VIRSQVTIFEQLEPANEIKFADTPNLGPEYTKPIKKSNTPIATNGNARHLRMEGEKE